MSATIYRKYRPQRWADIAGQNHVKVTLAFEAATGRIAHAYLFSGPRGTGKTSVARIMARALNCAAVADKRKGGDGGDGEPCGTCEHCAAILESRALDIVEIDAASHRGIDSVRENIIENARFSPARLPHKVFIIDEVHMLTTEAFNALLKTLEEPPAHAVFILATTELHKVPPTIVSRCQRFDFRKIPFNDLVERLHSLAEREKVKVDRRTLEEIARHSDGCLRDAEGLLGKVLTVGDGKRVSYDEALVVLPRSDYEALSSFVEALLRRDARTALSTIGDCLESGVDIDQFAGDAVELLRKVLVTKLAGNADIFAFDLDERQKKDLADWAALAETPRLAAALELLVEKRREVKTCHPPQLPLELAAVKICEVAGLAAAAPAAGAGDGAERAKAPAAAPAKEAKTAAPAKAHRAEAAPQADETPVTTIDSLKSLWPEFVKRAGDANHGLPYILGVGEPIGVVGKLVRIGFDFAFHRDKLNEAKNRRMLEDALAGVLNAKVRIEGVLLEKKEAVGHDDAAPAETAPAAQAAAPAVDASILSAFGGRVVE
jgi:DNA polymerase-3 subunit gamma/tau